MNSSERLRYIVLGSLVGAVFLFFVGQMMVLQLRDGEEYARQATAGTSTVQQTTSARGEIVDAYGKAFTGNTTVCNITVDSNYFSPLELNPLLLTLTDLCREYGCAWRDELPLSAEAPYPFTDDEAAVRTLRGKLQLSENASPEDVLYWLRDLYNLNDYTDTDVLDRLRARNELEGLSDAENAGLAAQLPPHPAGYRCGTDRIAAHPVPDVPLHRGGAAAAVRDPLHHDPFGIFRL